MSRQLTEEEAQGLIASAPNKRSVYNWYKWLDGNWHQVISGVDYHCTDMSFRNLLYLKKKQYGVIRTVKIEDGFLIKKEGWTNASS
tara:strand:+ start:1876 stop:2133 length:258 start_codon:yes stop_codon:yes gene_type:complete